MYPCVAASPQAFIDQLAYAYIVYGYRFYVTGVVPGRLTPTELDVRLIEKFDLDISRNQRSNQRAAGDGSIHYLRRDRFWALISTPARNGNQFFIQNTEPKTGQHLWHDVWTRAITFHGYAVRAPAGKLLIKVEQREFKRLKNELLELAKFVPAERLTTIIRQRFHYEQYPGVQEQLYRLVECLNQRLKRSGLGRIEFSQLKRGRKVVRGRRLYAPKDLMASDEKQAA